MIPNRHGVPPGVPLTEPGRLSSGAKAADCVSGSSGHRCPAFEASSQDVPCAGVRHWPGGNRPYPVGDSSSPAAVPRGNVGHLGHETGALPDSRSQPATAREQKITPRNPALSLIRLACLCQSAPRSAREGPGPRWHASMRAVVQGCAKLRRRTGRDLACAAAEGSVMDDSRGPSPAPEE